MDKLTETVIRNLKSSLKAKDEASHRIIAEEVHAFMQDHTDVQVEDIVDLEGRIRSRLANQGSPGEGRALAGKRGQLQKDEWSKINLYMSWMAQQEEKQRMRQRAAQQAQTKAELQAQMVEARQRRAAEKAAKAQEHQQVEHELTQWQRETEERKARKAAQMDKLKAEREAQLEEIHCRMELAEALQRKSEHDTTARITEEAKRQHEVKKAARLKAKEGLKTFLLSNEANRKLKETEKQRQQAEDIMFMKQAEEQLERQERQRAEQLERIQRRQARQAEDAATRAPVKKWVAEEIIERQFQEKQAAAAAEDERRKVAVAARASKFRTDVASQLEDKRRARLAELEAQRAELEASMADLELSKKLAAEDKARELAKMRAFRMQLDTQIAERRSGEGAMTEAERKLNSKLLRELEQAVAAHAGAIPALHRR